MQALVSIIMPCYNAQEYIEEAIRSVIQQHYQNWELIIINDSSSDNSQEIIEIYRAQESRIVSLHNSDNIGAARSRNRGLELARGDYIAFLDSDDIWLPMKLNKQVALMQKEHIALCYSAYEVIDTQGVKTSTFHVPSRLSYSDMLKTSIMGTLTTIYHAKTLGKYYFEELGHEDYVMKLQLLKRVPFAQGINEPLAKYRIHTKSLSRNKFHAAQWQWKIYREVEHLSLAKSIYYFLHYAYFGVFKYR